MAHGPTKSASSSEERLAAIPLWRRQPYRLFFPIGLALTWAGVLHWVLVAVGVLDGYRAIFHSIAQVQGFLTSFAVGFLFTAIPRRTETEPPRAGQMIACAVGLPATVVSAWFEELMVSQLCWVAVVVVLLAFVVVRLQAARAARRPPTSFVWIPVALVFGIAGSVLTGIGGMYEDEAWHLHQLGRLVLLQGMFVGLILGVGGMVLPLISRGEAVADAAPEIRPLTILHLVAVLALLTTFVLEQYGSAVTARALRALLIAVVLVFGCGAHRTPTRAGCHRWLVWASVWFLPIGYVLAALRPDQPQVGLHVVFIAAFSLLTLSVGLHVALAHGGRRELVFGRPWQVPVFGSLLGVAVVLRSVAHFDPAHRLTWLGLAGAAFLLATVSWALLAAKGIARVPS